MDKLPIDQDPARAAALAAVGAPPHVPSLVLAADPPRLVFASPAAMAIFESRDEDGLALRAAAGAEPAFVRLLQLSKSLRPGAPARRERLATPAGSIPFEIRRLPGTPPLLVALATEAGVQTSPVAAGVVPSAATAPVLQPALAPAPPMPDTAPPTVSASAPVAAQNPRHRADVAAELAARFDGAPFVRFLWQTDRDGRLVSLTGPLADILRTDAAALLNRPLAETVQRAGADPEGRLAAALAAGQTWSHLDLTWPIFGTEAAVSVVLGGSPVRQGAGLDGYRGFGIVHLQTITDHRATADAAPVQAIAAAPEAEVLTPELELPEGPADPGAEQALAPEEPVPSDAPAETQAAAAPVPPPGTNVVQLRPHRPAPSMTELSAAERNAFREIARALGARPDAIEETPSRSGPKPAEARPAADEPAAAQAPSLPANPRVRDLIEIASRARSLAEDMGRSEPPVAESDVPQTLEEAELPAPQDATAAEPVLQDTSAIGPERSAEPAADAVLDRHLRSLVDRLPIGVLISRLEVPIFLNQTLLDLLGYGSADEFHDAGGLDHMFRGRSPEALTEGAAGGAIPLVTRSGEVLAVEARVQAVTWEGDPATMICLRPSREAEIVARLRATEQDLRGRDAEIRELHAILDTATDGVALIDDDGKLLSLNRAAQALFGYEPNELVGEPFTTLLVRESHQAASDYLAGLRSSGVASVMNDGRDVMGRARQGGSIPLFLTLGRVTAGGSNKFCLVLRDMTSWKKAERELNEARKQAERASALKSDFLAKVSHEIRTPLNAILGFAEVIMEERFGPVGNERYKDYLKDIHASGTHVMSLVNDLLDLSKIEAGRMELTFGAVDANKIVSECVSLMQPQAARDRVIVRMSLAQRLPNIVADERSLRQIVLNLLSNGVKFNEPGGQVIVSTALTDAGHAVIRIRDTGIGMTDAEALVAMEPFRQLATARVSGGTGLGLPLTKALVEANRASFTIKSKKKEGTLIEVAFPPTRVLAE